MPNSVYKNMLKGMMGTTKKSGGKVAKSVFTDGAKKATLESAKKATKKTVLESVNDVFPRSNLGTARKAIDNVVEEGLETFRGIKGRDKFSRNTLRLKKNVAKKEMKAAGAKRKAASIAHHEKVYNKKASRFAETFSSAGVVGDAHYPMGSKSHKGALAGEISEKISSVSQRIPAKHVRNAAEEVVNGVDYSKGVPLQNTLEKRTRERISDNMQNEMKLGAAKKASVNKKTSNVTSESFIGANPGKVEKHIYNKEKGAYKDMSDLLKSKDITDDQRKAIGNMVGKENPTMEDATNWFQGRINDPTLGDKMGAHKVPQKVAAGVGTAWLVSRMTDNKGQQSNAELYGQQQPYN